MDRLQEELKISRLIARHLAGDISEEEKKYLQYWKKKSEANKQMFEKLSQSSLYQAVKTYERFDPEQALSLVKSSYANRQSRRLVFKVLKYAAALLIPVLLITTLHSIHPTKEEQHNNLASITPGDHRAILILDDGSQIDLKQQKNRKLKINNGTEIKNKEAELIYTSPDDSEKESHQEVYNTILTPVKGEYAVTLEDGTKVWLNSKSKLKYPVQFTQNKRIVHLEGEAYFEAAHDQERPFIVKLSNNTEVTVLGTSFNISAYQDDREVVTTLVEGSVQIDTASTQLAILHPGEQLEYNKQDQIHQVLTVDPLLFTAWKDGRFVFDREPLESIMTKLERWYGVTVEYQDSNTKFNRISADLKKYENIDTILKLISEVSPVKFDYKNDVLMVDKRN
jgi:ferric-dicitrate binding protein FerR (iron transport regulator)